MAIDGKIDRSRCRSKGGTVANKNHPRVPRNVPPVPARAIHRNSSVKTSRSTGTTKGQTIHNLVPCFQPFRSTCPPREWNGGTILARARLRKKEKRQREPHHPPLAPDCASLALRSAGTALSSIPKGRVANPSHLRRDATDV